MPKPVRPYGSGEDAEAAALARRPPGTAQVSVSELASTKTVREVARQAAEAIHALNELTSDGGELASLDEVRDVIASLELMGQGLPRLCEQLARFLVARHEDGTPGSGPDTDFTLVHVTEALTAAERAADMMTASLDEARTALAALITRHASRRLSRLSA